MGDIFYRWDGFSYYASFAEFLPSVALITILWSIIAAIAALSVWLIFSISELFSRLIKGVIKAKDLNLFISIFVLSGMLLLLSKRLLPVSGSMLPWKLVFLSGIVLTSVFFTWLLRNRIEQLMNIVQEKVTPLVWIFSVLAMLSVPLVAYHSLIKQQGNEMSQETVSKFSSEDNRPNIILVTFDALTARDMSVYGYSRSTVPFITKWAKDASLFTRAQAESNATTATTASLMTGKRLWTHLTIHQKGSKPLRVNTESLPLMLKKNGYYNMAFITNTYASAEVLGIADRFDINPSFTTFHRSTRGFDIIDRGLVLLFGNKIRLHDWLLKEDFIFFKVLKYFFKDTSGSDVPPEMAFNSFLEVLDGNISEPYFAWIHVLPPHNPFLPPEPYMGKFESSPRLRTFNSQIGLLESKFVQETADIARGRYNEFIRYCDNQFEDFISKLSTDRKLKNTVVILSADHGESFEHNRIGHSFSALYEQVTHIPLIIKSPGQKEGMIIHELVEQVDLPATILELAKISVPTWMEGRSLVPLLHGEKISSKPIFSGFFDNNRAHSKITKGVVAVWEGDFKLIYYLHSEKSELFNLMKDPGELNNLFADEPEIGRHLLSLIQDNLKKANNKISSEE